MNQNIYNLDFKFENIEKIAHKLRKTFNANKKEIIINKKGDLIF